MALGAFSRTGGKRAGRPKKPAAPFPEVHCARCKHCVTANTHRLTCAKGHPLDATKCGEFRDVSVRFARAGGSWE